MTDLVSVPPVELSPATLRLDPVAVYLEGRKSPRSKRAMRQALERVARVTNLPFALIRWEQLEYVHTDAIRARLMAQYGPKTVSNTLVAVRGVLRTCWRLGLMSHEALALATDWDAVQASRLPKGREISPDELTKLSMYCRAQREAYSTFLGATFALLVGAGLRSSEVCNLPISSYVPGETRVRLIGKGDKEGWGVFGLTEKYALQDWLIVRKTLDIHGNWLLARVHRNGGLAESERLTTSALNHLCTDVAEAAGVAHFTPHDCRRTYCTRLLAAGMDLARVQRLMRHESPKTTALYDRRESDADAAARQEVKLWE
jgi:integrase/recombinase XerD